jgi:hypothetical protein
LQPGETLAPAATGSTLSACRAFAASPSEHHKPLSMSRCVLFASRRA